MRKVASLVDALRRIDGSSFDPVEAKWIDEAEKRHPGMPEDLKELYRQLGYGRIGKSRYMVHALLDPGDIYCKDDARELVGKIIVGDDFAGTCEAFDAANGWIFGHIGSNCRFEEDDECWSFVDFLNNWFGYQDKG